MQAKRVALFEFPVRQGIAPLASAYLQAVAIQSDSIASAYRFEKYAFGIDEEAIIERVLDVEADVYGFSCYVWNSGLVRRLLDRLVERRPRAHVILGGPQVMNKGETYLHAARENLVLCNGEGEYTFAGYLEQLLAGEPDLAQVNGLTYYRDGELITNEKQSRIRDLDAIPSPYLGGFLDPAKYNFAVYESNRGCPFKCSYCFWGAATNAKVNKFAQDRIFDEITWISENRFMFILFADANFGILERDIAIAHHLAACKKRTGFPLNVLLNASKNTPGRVTEITKILSDVGLIAAQPVSMQTVSPRALKAIERDNIKASSFTELQHTLTENGLRSFLEMIWPLPGETLQSFKDGFDELCRLGPDSFVVYPLMLINNVQMDRQREEYALVTLADPDPNSEAEIVVSTRDVTNAEYQQGLNLTYHIASLYSFKALRHMMEYLDAKGLRTFTDVASAFWQYTQDVPNNPYTQYIDGVVASMEYQSGAGGFSALGGAIHIALHAGADSFDDMLFGLAQREGWLSDSSARLRLEVDLLNRPLVYSNTPLVDKSAKLKLLRVEHMDGDSLVIGTDKTYADEILSMLPADRVRTAPSASSSNPRFKISYRTKDQIPYQPNRPLEFYHYHCQYKTRGETRSVEPTWAVV